MGWEHILSGRVSFSRSMLPVPFPYLWFRFAQYIYGVYLGLNGELMLFFRVTVSVDVLFFSPAFPHTDRASTRTATTTLRRIHSIATRL
jgi:hypothetical protein